MPNSLSHLPHSELRIGDRVDVQVKGSLPRRGVVQGISADGKAVMVRFGVGGRAAMYPTERVCELVEYKPAEAFPPGEFLREEMTERQWSVEDVSLRMGRAVVVVRLILAGKHRIDARTAKGLSQAFGTTPEYWLNLEASYQRWKLAHG